MNIRQFSLLCTTLFLSYFFTSCQDSDTQNAPANVDPAPQFSSFSTLDVIGFQAMMNEKNTILIDIRKPLEIRKGKIEGALEMDVMGNNFNQNLATLDKNKTYLVYGATGGRSVKACNIMLEKGFKRLYNLSGGYVAWKRIILNELMYQDTVQKR